MVSACSEINNRKPLYERLVTSRSNNLRLEPCRPWYAQFCICLIKHQVMEMFGRMEVLLRELLSLDGISGQLHDLAVLSSGKEFPASVGHKAGWPWDLVLTCWRREQFLLLQETNTNSAASNLYTIFPVSLIYQWLSVAHTTSTLHRIIVLPECRLSELPINRIITTKQCVC